ncbi:fumarylacetoacetate hydrolase family protein [Euryarchaeota archaeon]|jgi:2-keto-4-pentenoate hydratase/2-oxohepta-3-ene-1,7-dioic acid hydratase in catechol pathway|nr:fumarylacetoacetate hydrolase family protein [Euryarchaeota archaeon]
MSVGWACFRNYVAHAEEIGGETTDYPRFFIMPESSHVFSDNIGNNIIKLMNDNDHIDHEVELVIKLGQNLLPESMCVGCDTTNRTHQGLAKEKGWPWTEGKSFKGSAVLGTWTAWDEKVKEISLSVNDELRQCAKTSLMVHDVESLLFHLKRWYDLSPGDYIWTGTPKGVGTLKIGDRVNASLKNNEGIIVSKLDAICIN